MSDPGTTAEVERSWLVWPGQHDDQIVNYPNSWDPTRVHSRGLATALRKRWLRCCDIVPILDRLNE
jgi:hypothetical protein